MDNKGLNSVVKCNGQICLVIKGGKNGELIFWSEEKKALRVYKNINLHSPQIKAVDLELAPPQLRERHDKATMTVSNGQFVSFQNGDETIYGTVVRGGRKPKIMDVKGEFEYHVPAHAVTIEETPVMEIPDALAPYVVKKFKQHKELFEETIAFSADLYFQGDPKKRPKLIAHVSNKGYGGCMDSHAVDVEAYRAYCDAIEQVCKERGLSNFEVNESYILWLGIYKDLNISLDDHIGKGLSFEDAPTPQVEQES